MSHVLLDPESDSFIQDLRDFRFEHKISARLVDEYAGLRKWTTGIIENNPNMRDSKKLLENKQKIAEFIYRYQINPGQFAIDGKGGYRMKPHARKHRKIMKIVPVQTVQQDTKTTFAKSILISNLNPEMKVMILNKML